MDDIVGEGFALRGITARVTLGRVDELHLRLREVRLGTRRLADVTIDCPQATLARDLIECRAGTLKLDTPMALRFRYGTRQQRLDVTLMPDAEERWQATLLWAHGLRMAFEGTHVQLARLAGWLPTGAVQIDAGRADLSGTFTRAGGAPAVLELTTTVRALNFADATGRRAGERIGADLALRAVRDGSGWRWHVAANWDAGEAYWHPVYLGPAARALRGRGRLDGDLLRVEDAQADLADVGRIHFAADWDRVAGRLRGLGAYGEGLDFGGLYAAFIRPFFNDRAWARGEASGRVDAALGISGGRLHSFTLRVRDGGWRHESGSLTFTNLNADLPWRHDAVLPAWVTLERAQFRELDLGPITLGGTWGQEAITLEPTRVAVLDGAVTFDGARLQNVNGAWRWELSGALQPTSMAPLMEALRWPVMHGTVSGVIPRVWYQDRVLQMDGALLLRIFDGTVVVKDLRVSEPFSAIARVNADLDMRHLDLELITRAFSFGSVTGRIDASVADLELVNWRPVAFDARVASSPGHYPRKISQRAVENISALGGASASAAIQRSVLRFFDQFGYEKMGLSCRLANDVCEMDGIEDLPHGYLIVKGGGIPALSVIGYNRQVAFSELVARLKRVTQREARPIVR